MQMQNRSVELLNNVARPKNGTGEIITKVGRSGLDVSVTWKDNVIQKSELTDANLKLPTMMMRVEDPSMQEAIVCYKCWVDTDTGAWICLPTAC